MAGWTVAAFGSNIPARLQSVPPKCHFGMVKDFKGPHIMFGCLASSLMRIFQHPICPMEVAVHSHHPRGTSRLCHSPGRKRRFTASAELFASV